MEAIEGCVEQRRALDISISIRNVTTTHVPYNHADAVIRVLKGVLLCYTISRPLDNLIFDCFFDHSSPHLYFFITVHIRYNYIYFFIVMGVTAFIINLRPIQISILIIGSGRIQIQFTVIVAPL